jgi:prepilin-type N-terminal cleavage/methylation domain-containing protein/prepilin-type processing-associated H-X9-DG protein
MIYKIRKFKAFSLVELLIVISVISILVSILIPTLNRTREESKRLRCIAHQKDIGKGYFIYAEEHGGYFPNYEVLGGWGFRAAPGYIDTSLADAKPENYGIAALFDRTNIIPGNSDIWVCLGQRMSWMRDIGNTYAFKLSFGYKGTDSRGERLYYRYFQLPSWKGKLNEIWILWDNFTMQPGIPGEFAKGQWIKASLRKFPHNYNSNKNRNGVWGVNALYADGHAAPNYE